MSTPTSLQVHRGGAARPASSVTDRLGSTPPAGRDALGLVTLRDELPRSAVLPARRGSVYVHRNEVVVAVESADTTEVVDRSLLMALLSAGVAAEKEGPHVTEATSPALTFGKVRVTVEGAARDRHLAAARDAAVHALELAGCRIARND